MTDQLDDRMNQGLIYYLDESMVNQPVHTCASCKHIQMRRVGDYDYPTCERSNAPAGSDGTFCGQMRLAGGQCGPTGTLWEAA